MDVWKTGGKVTTAEFSTETGYNECTLAFEIQIIPTNRKHKGSTINFEV